MVVDTTYFWQVTARNSGGSNVGSVWSFTTAVPPADLMALDSFTGTGPLTSHVPDVNQQGTPWQVHGATGTPALSGGRVGISPGSGHVQAVLASGAANIRMSVDYHVGTSPNQMASLVFRFIDAERPLAADVLRQCGSPVHTSGRRVYPAGLVCAAASGSERFTHRLEVRASGSQLTGWWDGLQMVAATSTSCSRPRMHGFGWNTAFDTLGDVRQLRDPAHQCPAATGRPLHRALPMRPPRRDNTTLSWSATGATSYDVPFGTANPPPPVTPRRRPTYAPAMRTAPPTSAVRANARALRPVWSFTTPRRPRASGPPIREAATVCHTTALPRRHAPAIRRVQHPNPPPAVAPTYNATYSPHPQTGGSRRGTVAARQSDRSGPSRPLCRL